MDTENKLYVNKVYLKVPEDKIISCINNQNLAEIYTDYSYNDILTIVTVSATRKELIVAVPYDNIAYVESCEQEDS